jgi:flagellar basal-body rod protein FlgF
MINRIFSTLGGKSSNEKRLDILANNVANAQTPGFKVHRPTISVASVGTVDDTGSLQQTYVNIVSSYVRFSDAPLIETGNKFDFAIDGDGFFAISTPKGTMYTRNGQFTLDSDKKLVIPNGGPVLGQSGSEITITGTDVKIETDGSIFVDGTRIDGIKIVDFEKKASLINIGRSLFENSDVNNREITPEQITVRQGAYESSNVDVITEMVEIINAIRAHEAYAKVDEMVGDSLQKLIDMGRS